MRTVLLGVSTLVAALALACSDADGEPEARPSEDAGVDAPVADAGGGDSGAAQPDAACADCAWFPAECSKGALCAVDVEGLDPRAILFSLAVDGDEITAVGTYGSIVERTSGSWRHDGVGAPDALRGTTTLGDEQWVAGSVEGVFIRDLTDGARTWTGHRPGPYYYGRNLAVTGLFSERAGTWVWAATATTCAPVSGSDGIGLVRLRRREAQWLEMEPVIQHEPPMSRCLTMHALDGVDGALWVAGEKGMLYKVTDLEASPPVVTPEDSGTTRSLLGVWAEPTGHLFVVGKDGAVQHRPPGGAFAPIGGDVPPVAYHAVRGTSPTDVWIAGEDATVMRYDGERWTRVPIAGLGDRRPTLRAIAALTPDRVWVAGDNALLGLAREDGRTP